MRRVTVLILGLAVSGSSVSIAGAEEKTTRLKEVVVTATKSKTPAKEVTRAVSIVDGEGLSESRPLVVDALRDVPGVYVRRTGQAGRTTSLVLRGASVTQVQVVVDGTHVASPTTGFFDFQFFSPAELERIEVMRGPASVLYGADAMAGVVSLVTRRGEGPLSGTYTQEIGNRHTFREMASAQAGVGNWHLSGSASRFDTDGVSDNDEFGNTATSARVGYDFSEENKLDFSVRHNLTTLGLDDGAFRPDPNRLDRFRQTVGSATWENSWNSWWSQTFRLSSQLDNSIDNDPSDGSTNANSLTKLDTERYGAEWRNRFTPAEWDTVTLGFEFEDREADRRTGGANQNFSKAQQTRAVFAQNEWKPIDPLTLIAGGRFFHESAFGSDHVWDASASYFFDSLGLKLRGGYGEGFRVPTLNELYFPNFGNTALGPEKSETVEVGLDQTLLNNILSWAVTVHRTNFQDLIQIVRTSPTASAPVNVGKARVEGVEFEAEIRPTPEWTLKGSYTNTSAHEKAPGQEELLRIPNNTYGMGVRYTPGRWEVRLDGLLISSREESVTGGRVKAEGYPKLDFYAAYRFKEWLKGYLRVENLTNRNYVEIVGFPTEGITGILGVTLEK